MREGHPAQETLALHACGDLPAGEGAGFEAHLALCADCRGQAARLQGAAEALRRFAEGEPARPPGGALWALRAARRGRVWRLRLAWGGAIAAAAVAVAALWRAEPMFPPVPPADSVARVEAGRFLRGREGGGPGIGAGRWLEPGLVRASGADADLRLRGGSRFRVAEGSVLDLAVAGGPAGTSACRLCRGTVEMETGQGLSVRTPAGSAEAGSARCRLTVTRDPRRGYWVRLDVLEGVVVFRDIWGGTRTALAGQTVQTNAPESLAAEWEQ
ncbi:MAG: hypothetical protein HY608_00770 [Planctomycetes bacterium]|nr:hypothetical protein [Planctomycetota bacterium]